ncbi:MAG: methyltransferase type 12 [uncultured bacterium]|nr:MAG: methyltransferase type 12 [uncultured bacterium]
MKRNCEICGGFKNKRIYHQRFILPTQYYFHSGYDVVICEKCGFVYADNIPDQNFFEAYYKEMSKKSFYIKSKVFKKEKNSNYEKEMFKRLKYSFSCFKKYLKKDYRILDLGCYTGELMKILKDNGYSNLIGVDPSDYAVKVAKHRYGIRVIKASIFDDLKNLGKFDFVIINHVLEHIKNLNELLKKVRNMLNSDGKIYVETPDADNFFISQSNKYLPEHQEAFQQFSVEHINFFTKKSTNNLLSINGFQKLQLQTRVSVIAIVSSIWKAREISKDETSFTKLTKYVENSKKVLSVLQSKIIQINKKYKAVYVWGAGVHTQKLLAQTDLFKIDIKAFVDSNPNYYKAKLINKPIISPTRLVKEENLPILISSKGYQENIKKQIEEMGLKNTILTLY